MDWSRVEASRRRTGGFAGESAADEDAYYSFFSGDSEEQNSNESLRRVAKRAIGGFGRLSGLLVRRVWSQG